MKDKAITIDASYICTLECYKCWRQTHRRMGVPPSFGKHQINLDDIKKLMDMYTSFSFCGQMSDPIFNPYIIEILKVLYENKKRVSFNTAATSKKHNREWYTKAYKANPDATWTFGLDGLPEESCLHRINQDGEFLFEMMKLAREHNIQTVWQYIVFSYNEYHIDEAMALAEKYDIQFQLYVTKNFLENDPYQPRTPEYK